jgi:hypothetical protein
VELEQQEILVAKVLLEQLEQLVIRDSRVAQD